MYIQGFNTFAFLDRYFDLYASVSRFVARFVSTAYGIRTPVIPAFVELDRLPSQSFPRRYLGVLCFKL
jgi:hypothetical protein